MSFEIIESGTITDVPEFYAGSAHCGLKRRSKRDDICIIYTPKDTVTSAVFTTNKFAAAPVLVGRKKLAESRNIKGIVVNAGIANACTGKKGHQNCLKTIQLAAESLNIGTGEVLATSTGIIGRQLPMKWIGKGIKECSKSLSPEGGHIAAGAILTTDRMKKEISVKINTGKGKPIIIGAIAKGSGMIEPNMATMLAFVATNALIDGRFQDMLLAEAVEDSFNAITVDGCQSTNDTVFIQSNGESSIKIEQDSPYLDDFRQALFYVLKFLALKIVQDGEGATKFVEITIEGAKYKQAARKIAKKVANSNLFKTAVYGRDLNWGRICAAVGAAGQEVDQEEVDIYLNGMSIVKAGIAEDYNQKAAARLMKEKELVFRIDLNQGEKKATVWTSDLSHDYVSINSKYST